MELGLHGFLWEGFVDGMAKKIAGYAPDIVGAIVSGGATLPATAMRIISKELTGIETDNPQLVEKAVNEATPDQLLKLRQANNDFIIKKMQVESNERANERAAVCSSIREPMSTQNSFKKTNQRA